MIALYVAFISSALSGISSESRNKSFYLSVRCMFLVLCRVLYATDRKAAFFREDVIYERESFYFASIPLFCAATCSCLLCCFERGKNCLVTQLKWLAAHGRKAAQTVNIFTLSLGGVNLTDVFRFKVEWLMISQLRPEMDRIAHSRNRGTHSEDETGGV